MGNWFWSLYAIVYDFGVRNFKPYWGQVCRVGSLLIERVKVERYTVRKGGDRMA